MAMLLPVLFCAFISKAQMPGSSLTGKKKKNFSPTGYFASFIENIGQYGELIKGYEYMGEIQFGCESSKMIVLFTPRGLIFLQKCRNQAGYIKNTVAGRHDCLAPEKERTAPASVKYITMEWEGINTAPVLISERKTSHYNTYGLLQDKAYGYKKITYKDIYPGIDLEYSINAESLTGFEYSLIVRPSAHPGAVKIKYGGDIKQIQKYNNQIFIKSGSGAGIQVSKPFCYYRENVFKGGKNRVDIRCKLVKNTVSYYFPSGYDKTRLMIIDPFISPADNLDGGFYNKGIAKDVDFDYEGNVYVSGGGSDAVHKLAKYDSAGNLLWTFSGSLLNPAWNFGGSYGGWVVDKASGAIYLGQGFNTGSRIIRLNTSGLYDNYISNASTNFRENWKMIWNCANANPELLIGGGTTLSNLNFTTLSPPATSTTPVNITGLDGTTQDIADMVIDPLNNELYTLFASGSTPAVNNKIYKHTPPYNASSLAWSVPSGFTVMKEADNKPYLELTSLLPGFNTNDNAANMLAINSMYLFYWDGKNLKAFDKVTGADAGSPLITNLPAKYQGGIYADECNNVFIGYNDGKIKVYRFNGVNFDDTAQPDISIPGFSNKSVYDLVYNSSDHLLYASGNGFVSSFSIASYCGSSSPYHILVTPDCVNDKATAVLVPAAPVNTTVTYSLYTGTALLAINTTGIFTGLSNAVQYKVKATVNQNCSGARAADTSFSYPFCPPVLSTTIHTTCGNSNGSLLVNPLFGTPPYSFSLDGVNFQTGNLFSNLVSGYYVVTVKDALGQIKIHRDTIKPSLPLVISSVITDASCNLANGVVSVAASGGSSGYLYSLNGIVYQAGNSFSGLAPGNYIVYTKDSTGCSASSPVQINAIALPSVSISKTAASCFNNGGTITVVGSGGTLPYLFNINGGNYQQTGLFTGLATGTYTTGIKDATGCVVLQQDSIMPGNNTVTLSISNPAPVCKGNTAVINAISNANSFSWFPATDLNNPAALQPLASPSVTTMYYLTAVTGICSRTDSVIVQVNPLPVANAGSDTVVCNGKTIQLNGSGGVQYSWSPSTYLSNTNTSGPLVINPLTTVAYSLSVIDFNGCTSVNNSVVTVMVLPPARIFAGNDTIVAINQLLPLFASGINGIIFTQYLWSPAVGLNNPRIQNPVATIERDIDYTVEAFTGNGCRAVDSIKIKAFNKPEIYVPSAFTPNGDGLNDILRAMPVGIKKFHYFTVFNRYGQIVFSTTNAQNGWNGVFKGRNQDSFTFAWIAEGTDYKGIKIKRKGYTVLLR